jgi:hypothetical protein
MQLSPTLCIRNQVDCCVIDVCSSSGCKQSDGRTDEREYYHFYCFEHKKMLLMMKKTHIMAIPTAHLHLQFNRRNAEAEGGL